MDFTLALVVAAAGFLGGFVSHRALSRQKSDLAREHRAGHDADTRKISFLFPPSSLAAGPAMWIWVKEHASDYYVGSCGWETQVFPTHVKASVNVRAPRAHLDRLELELASWYVTKFGAGMNK